MNTKLPLVLALLVLVTIPYFWMHNTKQDMEIASLNRYIDLVQSEVVAFTSKPAVDQTLVVPQLNARFHTVPELTLSYFVDKDKHVEFVSREMQEQAGVDAAFAGCATSAFPTVTLSNQAISATEFKGYRQITLNDHTYLNVYPVSGVCYGDAATPTSKNLLTKQSQMFDTFISSAESIAQ